MFTPFLLVYKKYNIGVSIKYSYYVSIYLNVFTRFAIVVRIGYILIADLLKMQGVASAAPTRSA